jgi:elongation factor Ts
MSNITASMVKELREMTGAGMLDCKKALAEVNGDMEAAIDWLRTKGLAAAAKKAGRVAAEGLIGVAVNGKAGAVVEVNSETDFVAKNDRFQEFVRNVANIALNSVGTIEAVLPASYPNTSGTVQDRLTDNVATIGENQNLRRVARVSVEKGYVASYVHNAAAPNLGKIGVLVALESEAGEDVLAPLGKQIAMHIAASTPLALDENGLDAELMERERAIATEKAAQSGKPANIVEKMVDGAIAKFAKENSLLNQLFVMDGKTPVADVVAQAAKEAGTAITLTAFVRYGLGEGIERQETDFASEVAAVVNG